MEYNIYFDQMAELVPIVDIEINMPPPQLMLAGTIAHPACPMVHSAKSEWCSMPYFPSSPYDPSATPLCHAA
jgi:hypothetical protein